MLGYSWYCFRNVICAELDITCDSPGVSQKHWNIWTLVSIRWKFIYECLILHHTSCSADSDANICCAPATETALICINKEGFALLRWSALQASGGCPWISGRADQMCRSWNAAGNRDSTVGPFFQNGNTQSAQPPHALAFLVCRGFISQSPEWHNYRMTRRANLGSPGPRRALGGCGGRADAALKLSSSAAGSGSISAVLTLLWGARPAGPAQGTVDCTGLGLAFPELTRFSGGWIQLVFSRI